MPKQLKLRLEEDIWGQMAEEAKEQSVMLLSRLIKNLWRKTNGASNDRSRKDH